MQLINFDIDRIIIHQVFQRDLDGNIVTPKRSHEYTRFDDAAMFTFKSRVREALGQDSKAVQMQIVNQNTADLPVIIDNIIEQNDEDFAVSSYDLASKLANAQHTRAIPGGIIVIFTGKQRPSQTKFLGIIKAEVHSGYEKFENENGEISLKFIEDLLLTPGARLYKTAGFFEKTNYNDNIVDLNEKWAVLISDYQISKTDGKAAAKYFYSDFLGCGYPQTSARTTKHFYDATSSFIAKLEVSDSEKNNLLNALTTYLKVDNSSTASAAEFAGNYFSDIDTQDSYTSFMKQQGLPTTAFTKDIEHVQSKLKFRKISFKGNVKISAPPEAFGDLVIIETVDGDLDASGNPAEWTRITVKDRVLDQE